MNERLLLRAEETAELLGVGRSRCGSWRQEAQRRQAGTAWAVLGLVFTEADGTPLDEGRIRRTFIRLVRELGISHHRVYDLRHTMATLMLANGENPKVMQERLGHSSASVTLDTYSSVLPIIHAQAADRLASRFVGPRLGTPEKQERDGGSLHDPLDEGTEMIVGTKK